MEEILQSVELINNGEAVRIIDQTLLPNSLEYLTLDKAEDMFEAIHSLRVRGAPAIGIFAGYAAYVLARKIAADDFKSFRAELNKICDYLDSSRPTAVNLVHATARMKEAAKRGCESGGMENVLTGMEKECISIHNEDIAMCKAISEYGLSLVKDGDGILTHCNAGPLATSRYGTGLGTLFLGKERGYTFHAYCDETRPLLQGSRLTAYELNRAGIDVTLICDNMANTVMKQGRINACFVGADRIAANGDTANKIGTCGVAVLAKHYGIPFYVFAPSSTVDFSCACGNDIVIEQRSPDEIYRMFFSSPVAPEGIKCYNPAFDVTDASLITAIITEKGICRNPNSENLAALLRN